MLAKVVIVCVILGLATTEPIRAPRTIPNDLSSFLSDKAELFEIAIKPEAITSLVNILKGLIGYKISAIKVAVHIVHWVKSNYVGITIGGVIALGICKITGKCNLEYDQSFSKLSSFITSERLEMAQKLLMTAVNRYMEDDEYDEVNFE